MWIVLIVAVVIVVGALAAIALSRPRGSDLTSVRKYHSALGTIEHLAERTGQPTGGVAPDGPGGGGGGGPGRTVPPVAVRGGGGFPDPESPIVFDDSRPGDHHGAPAHRADRAQRHALESMNHRPRRTTAVMVVVILVALFVTLAVLGSRHPKSADRGHTPVSSSVSATSSSAGPAHRGGHTDNRGHAHRHGHKGATAPTTTVPTRIVALSSTPLTAVYPAGPDPYTVKVSASGPCWVLATSPATGATLWTGTIQAGGSQIISATGVITVELGAPTGTLALDDVPVVFPTPVHTPFVATFQPTGPSAGTAATSTTSAGTPATTPAG